VPPVIDPRRKSGLLTSGSRPRTPVGIGPAARRQERRGRPLALVELTRSRSGVR